MNALSRRDWYTFVLLIALAIFAQAAFPRYVPADERVILDTWRGRLCYVTCKKDKPAKAKRAETPARIQPVDSATFDSLWKATPEPAAAK